MSKKTLDKLTADEKKIVMESAKEASDYQRQVSQKKSDDCLAELKKSKTVVNEISPAEMVRFHEATKPVVEKYLKVYDAELGRELYAEIA